MKKNAGFSLMETLILLMVSALLILASFPVLTQKGIFKGKNKSVITCIQKDHATLGSSACIATINGSLYNRGNYFDTLLMFVDDSSTSSYAMTVLKTVCDKGGKHACNKIIDRCANDSSNCSKPNDLDFYLKLLPYNSNINMDYLRTVLFGYYNAGSPNIKTEIDNLCCTGGTVNLACAIKGIGSCTTAAWSKDYGNSSYLDDGNDVAVDSNGNAYLLITTNNNISIVKVTPYGNTDWSISLDNQKTNLARANKIIAGSSGYLYVVGTAFNTAGSRTSPYDTEVLVGGDIALIKLNAYDGSFEWAKGYDTKTNTTSDNDYGINITTDNTYIYLIGYSDVSDRPGYRDLRLLKIKITDGSIVSYKPIRQPDPSGDILKNKTNNEGRAIAISDDPDDPKVVFAVDHKYNSCPDDSHVLIGRTDTDFTDTSTNPITSHIVQVLADLYIKDMTIYDGKAYIVGYNRPANPYGILIVYDIANDKVDVVYGYDPLASVVFNSIASDSSGNLYVAGTYNNNAILLLKLDTSGNVKYEKTFTASTDVFGNGIAFNSTYAYIAGQRYISSGNDNAIGFGLPFSNLGTTDSDVDKTTITGITYENYSTSIFDSSDDAHNGKYSSYTLGSYTNFRFTNSNLSLSY